MKVQNITEDSVPQLKQLMTAVDFSGERYVIETKDGLSAAIVPLEDLEVLEQLERVNRQRVFLS